MKGIHAGVCLCAVFLAQACGSSLGPGTDAGDVAIDSGATDAPQEDGSVPLEEWILRIDNSDDRTGHKLVRISVAEADYGTVSVVCEDVVLPDSVPADNIISSLTFNNGKLYASGRGVEDGDTLFLVDPCSCTASNVGAYGYSLVAGITSNGVQNMFGISGAQDLIFSISPATALGTLLGNLLEDWGTVGLTWSGSVRDSLWGISGTTDELYEFSALDGSQLNKISLNFDFTSVGVEYHPGLDTIYACSGTGELLVVDGSTGLVTVGPDMALGSCNNLAAPFGSVECVD